MMSDALTIVFQPVVELRSGIVSGAEALARFAMEPRRTPDIWFNEAWEVGLGIELEISAIRRALASLDRLPESMHLAVNVSPQTLLSPLLHEELAHVSGHRIIVEMTEHARVEDYVAIRRAVDRLRARGVRLAIDDAGAGFSSLQHILHLRPELIKLDRSLTQAIDTDPVRYALAAALVTFAVSLDAQICAEGIEKESELVALQRLGIAYGQGYFLARPGPLPLPAPPPGFWLFQGDGQSPGKPRLRPIPMRPARIPSLRPSPIPPSTLASPAVLDVHRLASLYTLDLLDTPPKKRSTASPGSHPSPSELPSPRSLSSITTGNTSKARSASPSRGPLPAKRRSLARSASTS